MTKKAIFQVIERRYKCARYIYDEILEQICVGVSEGILSDEDYRDLLLRIDRYDYIIDEYVSLMTELGI